MRRSLHALGIVLLAVTAVLIAGSPAIAVDNGQIGIQPADEPDYFHVNLAPGAATHETAVISNHSSGPITLLTYPVDARTTPQGGFGFAAQSDAREGVGAWARLSATAVSVPAHDQVRLPLELSVPATTPPGDYFGGIVIQAPPVAGKTVTVQGGTAVQLNIVQRQAARIYLTVAGTRHNKLETGGLTWKQEDGRVDFSLVLRNSGNTVLHPSAVLTTSSTIGSNQKLTFNTPESLLPGDTITLHTALPGSSPVQIGSATAQERSEAGSNATSAPFTYIPWGVLLGVIAAIGLLVILGYRLGSFLRRARRALALADEAEPPSPGRRRRH